MLPAWFSPSSMRARVASTGSGRFAGPVKRGSAGLSAALLAVSLLTGCGRDDTSPQETPASAVPTAASLPRSDDPTPTAGAAQPLSSPAPPRERPILAGSIVWTIETDPETGAPLAQLDRIATNSPRIVASLPVALGIAPANATATWTYNNTALPAVDGQTAIPSGAGTVWISFALEAPAGSAWPAGVYQVLISIDGKPAAISTVDVRAAE